MGPTQWLGAASTLYRTFGARGALFRAKHEVRRLAGWFRAAPRRAAPAAPGTSLFSPDPARFRSLPSTTAGLARAGRVLAGEHQAFRHRWRPLPKTSDAWLRHPATGAQFPLDPWWRIPLLSPTLGDIKDLWEPARFAWAYDLIRGYLLTGDEAFPEAFFAHFDRWRESSPPFRGPLWACGQETTIRAIALLHAESAFAAAAAATPERSRRLREVLAWSGERVDDAIEYAISQRNNHGVSEAAGLIALGARFDRIHPAAAGWQRRGTEWLARLVAEQFASDGWYIQHSFTYLRATADQCVVAARALAERGVQLPAVVGERLRTAAGLIGAVIEPLTGIVPNHGPNDGAFVHPTTSAEYRDFRPLMTALASVFGADVPEGVDADAETLAWLGAARLPPPPAGGAQLATGPSGWAAARVGPFALFFRAGRYDARPGHLDPLVVDLRVGGREVLVDPGTYAYNGPPPWRNGLTSAAVHNGPLINGVEPGIRGPRFLWYAWPEADLTAARMEHGRLTLEGVVPGRVRRKIEADVTQVTITDTALTDDAAEISVCWLLHPDVDPSALEVEGPAEIVKAAETAVVGWFAPHYGQRVASRAVLVRRPIRAGESVTVRVRAPAGDLFPRGACD